jgi:hypothetical protein
MFAVLWHWFLTSKNFYRLPFPKWPPQYRTNSTLSDFNDISDVGRLWCPELIPDIEKFLPVAIFKMASTIPHKFYDYNLTIMESPKLVTDNRFKKYIKSYLWNWTMLNVCSIVATILKMETVSYVGRLWRPKLILDIDKFLPVAISKMATTIPHKFNIVRYHQNLICG